MSAEVEEGERRLAEEQERWGLCSQHCDAGLELGRNVLSEVAGQGLQMTWLCLRSLFKKEYHTWGEDEGGNHLFCL